MTERTSSRAGMALDAVLAAQAAAVPLAIAPGLLFHFDVTPKLLALLAGAAVALVLLSRTVDGFAAIWSERRGRIFLLSLAASAVWLAAATAFSEDRVLSLYGTGWRRFGAVGQFAILLSAAILACRSASGGAVRVWVPRAIALSGAGAALAAIAQYAGFDPVVRDPVLIELFQSQPPRPFGTLGHSVYLAAYLCGALFAGLDRGLQERGWWKAVSVLAAALCAMGLLLSGSRGALVGVATGLACWGWLDKDRIPWRKAAAALAAVALAVIVFAVSPAGAAFVRRVGEWEGDPLGGTRLLAWRDSLAMARDVAALGSGPDTFSAVFPLYQSDELAQAFPDVFHESPHNIVLDTLLGQGLPALAALLAAAAVCLTNRQAPAPLRAMLAAQLVAQQFVCFTLATAFVLYANLALLAGWGAAARASGRSLPKRAAEVLALALLIVAAQYWASDAGIQESKRLLERGDYRAAVFQYRDAADLVMPTPGADLWFSRALASAARSTPRGTVADFVWRESKLMARRAAAESEMRHGAWYHLAVLYAFDNNRNAMETSLRNSIAAAPAWFKPHWMLARMLAATGRRKEAASEAKRAAVLANGRHREVTETLAAIQNDAAERSVR